MSTVAHLHEPTGSLPGQRGMVQGRLAWIDRGVDRLVRDIADESQPVGGADLQEMDRVIRRMEAAKLALIAKADRQEVHRRSGASSTSAWVAGLTTSSGGGASRDVALAAALEEGLPITRAAFGAGEVSRTNAGIIADVMAGLPEELSDAERVKVEGAMVRDAKVLGPGRLRKAGLVAIGAAEKSAAEVAQHQEDQLVEQERRAYAASYVSMFDRPDGTTKGDFVVPTGAAQVLKKVLQSMTSPRRNHLNRAAECALADGQQPAGDFGDGSVAAGLLGRAVGVAENCPAGNCCGQGGACSRGASNASGHSGGCCRDIGCGHGGAGVRSARNADWDSLDWRQKRGRAFADLLEHLPTDKLTGKVASTVIVTMTAEQAMGAAAVAELQSQIDAVGAAAGLDAVEFAPSVGAARCDTGHLHSTSEARRLACGAGILPLVLGGSSVPLDLGRQERFFSEAQRTALAALYDECAAEGCDRPYAWSELHHEDPWSRGGQSDLDRAVPLCGFHHRRVHDPQMSARITIDARGAKTVTFHHSEQRGLARAELPQHARTVGAGAMPWPPATASPPPRQRP